MITKDTEGTVVVTSNITGTNEFDDKAMTSALSVEEVCSAGVEERMTTRTAMLCVQYLNMVAIVQRFIRAEQIENWKLQLQTIHDLMAYFAASGHTRHAQSTYAYLQLRLRVPETYPDTHKKLIEVYHVVRRSDRFCAGLSTYLIIEQVLMRRIETYADLTRGKRMTENQCLMWVLSMPVCASISEATHAFSGVSYETSDQYNDIDKPEMLVTPLI